MKKILLGMLLAAPFNAVTTNQAGSAKSDSFCTNRTVQGDGGVFIGITAALTIPQQTTLPDGGLLVQSNVKQVQFEETRTAVKSALINYMDNGLLTGARTALDLEQ